MNEDRERIRRLKEKKITPVEMYAYIGLLTALRVSHDSSDKRLSSKVETYPLNQSQISIFTDGRTACISCVAFRLPNPCCR